MVLNDDMISKAPVPNGFYKLRFIVKTDGVWRGEVEVHAEVNLGIDRWGTRFIRFSIIC